MALSETAAAEREAFRKKVEEQMHAMGIQTKECRDCGEPIIFLPTNKGKFQPVDMFLESHFANCPGADKFRRED